MAKILDLFVKIDSVMSNGFDQPGRILSKQFASLQKAGDKLRASMGDISAFQKMNQSVTAEAQRVEELRRSSLGASMATSLSQAKTQQLGEQYNAAKQRLQALTLTMPKNSAQLAQARKEVQELRNAYQASQKETQALEAQQGKLSQAYERARQRLNEHRQSLSDMANSLKEAGVNTDNLTQHQEQLANALSRVENAQNKLSRIRETLSWGNLKQVGMETIASVAMWRQPIKLAGDFEAAMARVKAVGFSNDDADLSLFARMREQALQLGADTKFTAIEAAGAQENLVRAGMTPQQVMKALPAVLNMASAEGMGIEQAASIIAKGLGGMNLSAELSPRLADILAYTSANTNTSIAALGEAFKIAAPVAASQNITMEQAASYLGILANKGFEGSEAGNALAKSIQRLAKRPTSAANALNELGVSTRTREGKMRELPDIMLDLNKKLSKFGENKQLEYMANIFGANYGSQMMAFMQATAAGDTERIQAGVYNSSFGRAQKMSDINLDTLNGQLTILGSAWDGLRTTIGEMFSPVVRKAVELLSSTLSKLNAAMKEFPNISTAIMYTVAGITSFPAAKGIFNIVKAFVSLPKALLDITTAGEAARQALGEPPTLISRIIQAFAWLKNVILAHPLLALGALTATVVYEVVAHWDSVKAWLQSWIPPNIWEELVKWCEETAASIKAIWSDFKQWLTNLFAGFNPFNWELPSWLGGGKGGTNQVNNAQVALGGYQPPEIRNAKGGIYSSPIWTWAAESGAEAIIPLTDKSRGIPLLMQAASIMGLDNQPELTPSVTSQARSFLDIAPRKEFFTAKENSTLIPTTNTLRESTSSVSEVRAVPAPAPVNITVNVQGGSSDNDLAARIAEAVRQTLSDLMNLEERVSYA